MAFFSRHIVQRFTKFVRCYSAAALLVFIAMMAFTQILQAQRISFGLYAQQQIMITPIGDGKLNFSDSQSPLISGSNEVLNIGILQDAVAIFEISAAEELDIQIYIDAPSALLNDDDGIPLEIRFAYSNTGIMDSYTARSMAIEIPPGFNHAVVPVLRRVAGAPGPPPTPAFNGSNATVNTIYLFVYGNLGPVGNIKPGLYEGFINIYVEYAN